MNVLDLRQRMGKFKIAVHLIEHDPETVMKVMSNFIVFRAENMFSEPVIEYQALSPLFQKVPQGNKMPRYDLIIRNGELLRAERKD